MLSITLASRALASSFLILVVWETAHTLFDVYVTQVRPSIQATV